mmetsp:Transcript_11697/g.27436  ORF Transcript_11697/g.27436 Transcript_11697/m.27436 type:complete len:167 (-) Transcript_11697:250-750(-)
MFLSGHMITICSILVAPSSGFLMGLKLGPSSNIQRMSPVQCICVDCELVDRCTAYHFVESKHEQPHLTPQPNFTPRKGSPKITVAIRKEGEEGFMRAWHDLGTETKYDEEAGSIENGGEAELRLTLPKFTTEYDVVACEDFRKDVGRWVRMMPEEIRRANPDFVPT